MNGTELINLLIRRKNPNNDITDVQTCGHRGNYAYANRLQAAACASYNISSDIKSNVLVTTIFYIATFPFYYFALQKCKGVLNNLKSWNEACKIKQTMFQLNGIDNLTKDKIINLVTALVPSAKIYLLDSRVKEICGKEFDIDIVLDAGNQLDLSTLSELREIVKASAISYKIEIIDLHNLPENIDCAAVKKCLLWKE